MVISSIMVVCKYNKKIDLFAPFQSGTTGFLKTFFRRFHPTREQVLLFFLLSSFPFHFRPLTWLTKSGSENGEGIQFQRELRLQNVQRQRREVRYGPQGQRWHKWRRFEHQRLVEQEQHQSGTKNININCLNWWRHY